MVNSGNKLRLHQGILQCRISKYECIPRDMELLRFWPRKSTLNIEFWPCFWTLVVHVALKSMEELVVPLWSSTRRSISLEQNCRDGKRVLSLTRPVWYFREEHSVGHICLLSSISKPFSPVFLLLAQLTFWLGIDTLREGTVFVWKNQMQNLYQSSCRTRGIVSPIKHWGLTWYAELSIEK